MTEVRDDPERSQPGATARAEEARAVALLRLGNPEQAIPELQRLFGAKIVTRLARWYDWLGDGDREDVYIEALTRVWERRSQFRSEDGSLEAWVWTITKNLARDRWRKQERPRLRAIERDDQHARARSSAEFAQYRIAVLSVLGRFSKMQQAVLRADLDVFPDSADAALLARLLNTSPESVYAQRSKAYKKLATEMNIVVPEKFHE